MAIGPPSSPRSGGGGATGGRVMVALEQLFMVLLPFALPVAARAAETPAGLQQRSRRTARGAGEGRADQGDAARGAVLFFQPFLACAKCHDGDAGTQFGPDISKAGKEATAEYLIESVLSPSKVVKKGYETVIITTTSGQTLTGLVAEEKKDAVTILDPSANGKRVTIRTADIERRAVGKQSLMPEGLVNLLSDRQQFLDLAKYLIEIAEQGPARAKELRPDPDARRDRGVREGHRSRGDDPRPRRQGVPPGRGDLHARLRELPRDQGRARFDADLAALRLRQVQERQRHPQPLPDRDPRLRDDDPANVDGAAAEVRRDPLHPQGVPRAA